MPNFKEGLNIGGVGGEPSSCAHREAWRPADEFPSALRARTIHLLTNYYSPEPTGSAPPIADFCRWLVANGSQVRVTTTRPSYPTRRVFAGYANGERDFEVLDGVRVRRLASLVLRGSGVISRLISEASFAAHAVSYGLIRRRDGADVVTVCPSILTVMVAPVYRAKGFRLVAIVHDVQSGLAGALAFSGASWLAKQLRRLEAWTLNHCDHLITLSDEMTDVLRSQGVTRPIVVIPPQVDVGEFEVTPIPVARPFIILYSGNFGRKQGLSQLVELARELSSRRVDCRLVLRGSGSEEQALKNVIKTEQLTNISVEPLVPRHEMGERFSEASVHLVPQDPRGANFAVPSKVFTIMSAARPFVGTADPGSPLARLAEATGAGFCTPPGEASLMADAVERLFLDRSLSQKMGLAGRRYVETHVDREVVCRRLAIAILGLGEKSDRDLV